MNSGVRMLALTDHDTVAGLRDFKIAAASENIHVINGVELSARWKKHDIHILGLAIDPENEALKRLLFTQRQNRQIRALKISQLLASCGIESALEKARSIAKQGEIGRPHFAEVLVREGYAADFQGAFTKFLGRGRKAYVDTQWAGLNDAVAGIIAAGGQAVIAHPLKYNLTRTKLLELIAAFKDAGGIGLEVVSGDTSELQINDLCMLCEKLNLLASTGSDYHGDSFSRISLGQQPKLPLNCIPIWHQWTLQPGTL